MARTITSARADEIANIQSKNRKVCVPLLAVKEEALLASQRCGAICGEQCFLGVRP